MCACANCRMGRPHSYKAPTPAPTPGLAEKLTSEELLRRLFEIQADRLRLGLTAHHEAIINALFMVGGLLLGLAPERVNDLWKDVARKALATMKD